jgi:RNA polymerase primary sigma factor
MKAKAKKAPATDSSAKGSARTSLGTYLKEISRISLLKREEEVELGRRIRAGDQEALQQLVEANLRFVVSIANKYRACGIALLDLINEGNIGLMEAAKRFDPERGVKFISYAVWWIRQAIMQALAEQCGSVRLPLKQAGLLYKIREKYEAMSKELGKEPNTADLAQALGLKVGDVEEIMRVSRKALSLESPIGEDSDTQYLDLMVADNIPPVDTELIKESLSQEIENLLNDLEPREKNVIQMRFGIGTDGPLTLEKVGEKLGLSRERIRQIEKKAKKKLLKKAKGRALADYLH